MTPHTEIQPGARLRYQGRDHVALWQGASGLIAAEIDRNGYETGVRETLVGLVEVCCATL